MLALAGLIFFSRPEPEDLSIWTPVSQPIVLAKGRVEIPPFIAARDRKFELFIASEQRIDDRRLRCLLGYFPRPCPDTPEVLVVDWQIFHTGKVEASGSSKDYRSFFSDSSLARQIGSFTAQKGQQYTIVLDVRKDAPELASTNPKLLVQTYPNAWLDSVAGKSIYRTAAAILSALLALAGATLLLVVPLLKRVLD